MALTDPDVLGSETRAPSKPLETTAVPLRVLALTVPLPGPSGVDTMAPLERQVQSLRALGVQVDVLEVRGMARVKYLQMLPVFRRAAARADLVHAHFGFCGWLARSQRRKPVVISFMGSDLLGNPDRQGRPRALSRAIVQINRRLARAFDRVIVKSPEMARVVSPVTAQVIPNGVDLEAFRPRSRPHARDLLGWPREGKFVLFPGHPRKPRKNFPLASLVSAETSRRLAEPVTLVPLARVAPEQVPLYMNACDAMLFTSFIEGSPNVVKEAMASELPAVSVPVGDVAELLDGVDGYRVQGRNVPELAGALSEILAHPPRTAGRARLIQRRLDLESVAHRIVSIYQELVGHPRHRAARVG